MNWLALRMLMGNRAKYVAMLFGITFASTLICQQCSIFCGVLRMCTGQIHDVQDAPIWVLSAEPYPLTTFWVTVALVTGLANPAPASTMP